MRWTTLLLLLVLGSLAATVVIASATQMPHQAPRMKVVVHKSASDAPYQAVSASTFAKTLAATPSKDQLPFVAHVTAENDSERQAVTSAVDQLKATHGLSASDVLISESMKVTKMAGVDPSYWDGPNSQPSQIDMEEWQFGLWISLALIAAIASFAGFLGWMPYRNDPLLFAYQK